VEITTLGLPAREWAEYAEALRDVLGALRVGGQHDSKPAIVLEDLRLTIARALDQHPEDVLLADDPDELMPDPSLPCS
jgi:hypothetical protein